MRPRRERWPALPPHTHDEPLRLFHGAALARLRDWGDLPRPRLVYLDPPFATRRAWHRARTFDTPDGPRTLERVAWRDDVDDGFDAWVDRMETLLVAIRDVLADDGSLLLHIDHHAGPYLAVACDRVFGRGDRASGGPGFRNELIWSYGLGGSSPRFYPRKHDTILWYTRGPRWFFDPPRVPATSNRMAGQTKKATDVFDIPTLNNMARERTGYPTQKPLALLERLVRAHTEPGDLVLDPCAGSGTTAIAAANLGRRAIAIDRADEAIATLRERLLVAGRPFTVDRFDDAETTSDASAARHPTRDSANTEVPAPARIAGSDAIPFVLARSGARVRVAPTDPHLPLTLAAAGDLRDDTLHIREAAVAPGGAASFDLPTAPAYLVRDVAGRERLLAPPADGPT